MDDAEVVQMENALRDARRLFGELAWWFELQRGRPASNFARQIREWTTTYPPQ